MTPKAANGCENGNVWVFLRVYLFSTSHSLLQRWRLSSPLPVSRNIWCVCRAALSQSLWSLMAKQVLTYTMTAPYTFLSGLILISELLPIPLPVQTNEVIMLVCCIFVTVGNDHCWIMNILTVFFKKALHCITGFCFLGPVVPSSSLIIIIILWYIQDNVYGAVIMAEPLQEFTRFIWWM